MYRWKSTRRSTPADSDIYYNNYEKYPLSPLKHSPCSLPACIQTTGVSSRAMTSQTVPSRFDLYPGYVLTESGTFFFRSNSRWYGCCDWLLVPRGVSLDSHRTWTDSWCADLLPPNKRIHSRNKRIHSRNKCIHSRKQSLFRAYSSSIAKQLVAK